MRMTVRDIGRRIAEVLAADVRAGRAGAETLICFHDPKTGHYWPIADRAGRDGREHWLLVADKGAPHMRVGDFFRFLTELPDPKPKAFDCVKAQAPEGHADTGRWELVEVERKGHFVAVVVE